MQSIVITDAKVSWPSINWFIGWSILFLPFFRPLISIVTFSFVLFKHVFILIVVRLALFSIFSLSLSLSLCNSSYFSSLDSKAFFYFLLRFMLECDSPFIADLTFQLNLPNLVSKCTLSFLIELSFAWIPFIFVFFLFCFTLYFKTILIDPITIDYLFSSSKRFKTFALCVRLKIRLIFFLNTRSTMLIVAILLKKNSFCVPVSVD